MYNNTEKRLINGIMCVKKRESYFPVPKERKEKHSFNHSGLFRWWSDIKWMS